MSREVKSMRSLIPFLLFMFSGCQEPEPVVSAPKPEPPKVEQKKVDEVITELPGDPTAQQKDPRDKPQRIHQLRQLDSRKIVFNGHTLTVWLMDDDSKRAEGMMWLVDKDVKDTEGMLFLFTDSQPRSFWMQNCPLGLDITYIDPKGKVLNIGNGKPFDESGVPSKGSAQYVLELKVGRAKKFGIKPGSILKLPTDAKAKE